MSLSLAGVQCVLCITVIVGVSYLPFANGRAILVEPPHRSSLWRFNYNTTVNPQDDNLNCGGYDWQWGVNGGRCGVCGDMYNGAQENDDFGKFASGIIVRKFKDGHYVNITFELSSNYLGYVEFKLCPRNSTKVALNQSCFDRYPLWIDESHGTRYYIGSRGGVYDIHVRLPGGLVCRRCVLQWKYKTGYRYNGDDTCKCLGCGRQEQYINCADIEVYPRGGWPEKRQKQEVTARPKEKVTPALSELVTSSTVQQESISNITSASARNSGVLITSTVSVPGVPTTAEPLRTSLRPYNPVTPDTAQRLSPSFQSLVPAATDVTTAAATPSIDIQTGTLTVSASPIVGIDTVIPVSTVISSIKDTIAAQLESIKVVPEQSKTPATVSTLLDTTTVENTQFVSVSNILHRFYPEYRPPFIFPPMLLPNAMVDPNTRRTPPPPRRRHGHPVPAGCDVHSDDFRCVARGIYNQSPGISRWCEINCRAYHCVSFMCECSCDDRKLFTKSNCHAIAEFAGVEGMDQWCIANCKLGYCPPNTCSVEDCRNELNTNGDVSS